MNQFKRFLFKGFFVVIIIGTLSHFVYEWSSENFLVGLFCPVNESTWEHMKLAFFPMLLFSAFLCRCFSSEFPCIIYSAPRGILWSTLLIPVIFYTYTGILGGNYFVLDLLTFGISIAQGFRIFFYDSTKCGNSCHSIFLWILIFLLTVCFFVFSYMPPNIPLFQTP